MIITLMIRMKIHSFDLDLSSNCLKLYAVVGVPCFIFVAQKLYLVKHTVNYFDATFLARMFQRQRTLRGIKSV